MNDSLNTRSTAALELSLRKRTENLDRMRDAVRAVCATASLAEPSWTDATITAGSTRVRASHIIDLRNALVNALNILGLPAPTFANSVSAGSPIRAVDVQEIRTAVR